MNVRVTTCRARGVRLLVALAIAAGILSGPAAAAPLSVSSSSLTATRTCTLVPVSGTNSVAAFDTYVRQGSGGNDSFGNATSMNVNSVALDNRRAYVRFDLSRCSPVIPSSATVTRAGLLLYVTAIPNQCRTHDVFRVGSSWGETSLTWNNQQPTAWRSINNPVSGERTASVTVGAAPCQFAAANQYVYWDVTSDVQAFVGGTANYGWMVRDDVEGSSTTRTSTYATGDDGTVSRKPQLIVSYTP